MAGIADRQVTTLYRNLIVDSARGGVFSSYRILGAGSQTASAARLAATIDALSELVGNDLSLLRAERPWSITDYAMGVEVAADGRQVHRTALMDYLDEQSPALEGLGAHTVEVFLIVRLHDPPAGASSRAMLEWCIAADTVAFRAAAEVVRIRRTRCRELVTLIRHAFRRGIPVADDGPGLGMSGRGSAGGWPDEVTGPITIAEIDDLGGPIVAVPGSLKVETELGSSHQSFLRVDEIPASTAARTRDVSDLLAALDGVEFPVDAALTVRRERSGRIGHHTLSLCVGAPSPGLLQRRVVALRRQLAGARLARPLDDQLSLFHSHLPGSDPTRASGPGLRNEPLGALPQARHPIGSESGVYVGHTLTGAPRPVLFDPVGGQVAPSPAAVLLTGAAGTGKTTCLQLILYHAFLLGSLVLDLNPRGDHGLERLPGAADHVEVFDLAQTRRFAGLLDPLRIGPPDGRETLAAEFLAGVLPRTADPRWRLEIAAAVGVVAARGGRTCAEVAAELEHGRAPARAAAGAIRAGVSSGLAALGFAQPGHSPPEAGRKPITILRTGEPNRAGNVATPALAHDDPVLLRLLAAYALHVAGQGGDRPWVIGFDDAASLLSGEPGGELVAAVSERSRTGGFTAIVATGAACDPRWASDTFGAALCFAPSDAQQAAIALELLGAGRVASQVAAGWRTFGPGSCLMRDYHGTVGAVQIDVADDRLLPLLAHPIRRSSKGARCAR